MIDTLAVLQFESGKDFGANLEKLISLYRKSDASLVLAQEVCLTGFSYERMEEAAVFSKEAVEQLLRSVTERILVLTVIEKKGDVFYNTAKVLHRGRVVHEQQKHKLFLLGDEHEHFSPGGEAGILPFEIEGTKIAILICFELRFPHLWQRIDGAEVILVPAMWGRNRAEHLVILSNALAVANRAYVMVADSANADMAKESAIITPWGTRQADNGSEVIALSFERREIKKIKRAIPYE